MLLKPGYSLTWAYSLTAETMMKIKQTTQKIVSLLIMVSLAMSVGVSAAPAGNESRLITDEAGYLVCQRCGPDHKDIYLMAEYPAGSREKSVNYHLVRDMSRYTFLMSSDAPATAANQTPDFWYIDKQSSTPALNSIVFDDDNLALSSAEHITVTEAGGKTRLNVIWANGKRNIFILDNP
jgi:hypothetical protein